MSAEGKKLGIGVVCVDWRLHQNEVHLPEQVRGALGVDVMDVISVPGPDGFLKAGKETERDALCNALTLLIGAHHPVSIALSGHYTCAANPVDEAKHDADIAATLDYYKKATNFSGTMIAYSAVHNSDTDWELKEIASL